MRKAEGRTHMQEQEATGGRKTVRILGIPVYSREEKGTYCEKRILFFKFRQVNADKVVEHLAALENEKNAEFLQAVVLLDKKMAKIENALLDLEERIDLATDRSGRIEAKLLPIDERAAQFENAVSDLREGVNVAKVRTGRIENAISALKDKIEKIETKLGSLEKQHKNILDMVDKRSLMYTAYLL